MWKSAIKCIERKRVFTNLGKNKKSAQKRNHAEKFAVIFNINPIVYLDYMHKISIATYS